MQCILHCFKRHLLVAIPESHYKGGHLRGCDHHTIPRTGSLFYSDYNGKVVGTHIFHIDSARSYSMSRLGGVVALGGGGVYPSIGSHFGHLRGINLLRGWSLEGVYTVQASYGIGFVEHHILPSYIGRPFKVLMGPAVH